jgi:hypothetical protein
MSQRQVLRQLAEAGQLRLQDFDAAGLARLLRQELITVTGTDRDPDRQGPSPRRPEDTTRAGRQATTPAPPTAAKPPDRTA